MRVLFISGEARSRGPTAAQLFADQPGTRTDFAGTEPGADDAVSSEQIDWADLILCMERRHATRLNDRYPRQLRGKQVVVLDIRQRYSFMDPELIGELREKAGPHLG